MNNTSENASHISNRLQVLRENLLKLVTEIDVPLLNINSTQTEHTQTKWDNTWDNWTKAWSNSFTRSATKK